MPFPIIFAVWVIGGVLFGAGAAVAVDRLITLWKGKRLAVLGERRVGKTVLIKYLTTGVLITDYEQGTEVRRTKQNKLKMGDLCLRIKKSKDVPGAKVDYPRWKALHANSDLTLYLFRADLVLNNDQEVLQRIEDDLAQIRRWRSEKERPLFLIATHCDLDPEYSEYASGRTGEYRDRIATNPGMNRAMQLSDHAPLIVGSLKTTEAAQLVVVSLLRQLH
jgi:hypothetical protein